MDYEQIIKKSLQFNNDIYCLTKKPFLSFNFGFKNTIDSTCFNNNANFCKQQQGDKWDNTLHFTVLNHKYPKISLWLFSNRTLSFLLSTQNYRIILHPLHSSILLNLSPNPFLDYQISAMFPSTPSVIGSFRYKNLLMSIHLFNENISFAYQIALNKFDINCGFKIRKSPSLLDIFTDSFIGIRTLLLPNQTFSIASGFVSDSYKIVLAYRNPNNRITYSYTNSVIYNNLDYYYANSNLLQYKYVMNNGSKIAFLYPLFTRNFYLRGSIRILNTINVKMSVKIDSTENSIHFNPTFGFHINFNQIAEFLS